MQFFIRDQHDFFGFRRIIPVIFLPVQLDRIDGMQVGRQNLVEMTVNGFRVHNGVRTAHLDLQ